MANIYAKSMRDALQEAREYREPEELTEMMPEPVKGYWDKDGAARGVPDIFYSMKKGNQKKNIHPKDLKKFEKDGWRWYDSTTEAKGHLSYDDWLKQVKGIKKGAYGVNSDEHAKYSGEWRAYIKGLFDNLPSAKGAKNVTKLSPTAHTKLGENKLDEIVGGKGEMTVTKDGGVMIIKTRDWQTYKAKGWVKREEVENESLDLSATGDTTTSNASQEVEGEELNEFWPFKKKPTGYNPKAYVKAYDLFRKAYDELKKSGAIDRKKQAELQQVYYHMVTDFLGSRDAGRLEIKTIDGTDKRWGDGKPFPKDDRD